jgi:hypothetical protein
MSLHWILLQVRMNAPPPALDRERHSLIALRLSRAAVFDHSKYRTHSSLAKEKQRNQYPPNCPQGSLLCLNISQLPH